MNDIFKAKQASSITYAINDKTRWVDGTPTTEVTPVTIW